MWINISKKEFAYHLIKYIIQNSKRKKILIIQDVSCKSIKYWNKGDFEDLQKWLFEVEKVKNKIKGLHIQTTSLGRTTRTQ